MQELEAGGQAMNSYISDLKTFLNNKKYMAVILIVALLSYGFAMTHVTVSIDDLEYDRYFGSGQDMLRAGRLGHILWDFLRTRWANSYSIEFLGAALFLLAAISFSILYRRVSGGQISMEACTVFSGVLISYPLINEIWEYTRTGFNVCGGYLLVALAVLLVHSFLHSGKRNYGQLLIAAFLTMWICSGYESLASVYVFTVFSVLALQAIYGQEKEKRVSHMLLQGMVYAVVLALGLLLRVVIHRVLLAVLHLEPSTNGATNILWGTEPAAVILKNLVWDILRGYILRGIIYFPLSELLAAGVVFLVIGVCACRKHGAVLLLPGAGMLGSLILLSVLQGKMSPYRTCQVFASFVAFTAMLVVVCTQRANWRRLHWIPAGVCALGCALCLYQSVYLNSFLFMNHLRSEEEAFVVRDVGTDLKSVNLQNKPVIFIGEYTLSDMIVKAVSIPEDSRAWQVYCACFDRCARYLGEEFYWDYYGSRLPDTNVNSILKWSFLGYEQEAAQKVFSFYGTEYTPVDKADFHEIYQQATDYAQEHATPAYPRDGYIVDVGEYLIVRMGENLVLW